ncbi:hypothetical protein LCGC14_1003490 [marine sediment metagenome]|uniref:Uncharacterized protein n=1 Tax=marine sediment metagenome TaxID=412755 RepID=A0A0F9N718_9ZZZZ
MILIIGYGSLMSRFGIDRKQSTREIDVFNPFIVRFNGFRGFNTIKDHYMDIGKNFNPVGEQVNINGAIDESGNSFECLAYYINDEDLYKIKRREGYPAELIDKIKDSLSNYNEKNNQDINIATFLWNFYPYQEGKANYHNKILRYRKNLGSYVDNNVINQTCYIPHPIKVKCQKNKFGLISIRTDIGAKKDFNNDIRLMTISEVTHSKSPPRESYFLECILGGVHGIDVRDLLSGLNPNDQEKYCIIKNLEEKIHEEWNKTQDWIFHEDDLFVNLKRSGILEYFPNLFS